MILYTARYKLRQHSTWESTGAELGGGSSAHFQGNLLGISVLADGIVVAELYPENVEPLSSQ